MHTCIFKNSRITNHTPCVRDRESAVAWNLVDLQRRCLGATRRNLGQSSLHTNRPP